MFASTITPSSWSAADEERSLAILGRLLLEEITRNATADQRRGMLVAIGRRVADLMPMGGETDLGALARRINEFWAALNWGSMGFEIDDNGIDIVHRSLPPQQREQLQDWDDVLPPVLGGAYDRWFQQLGGDTGKLQTRILRQDPGQIELRHGF